MAVPLQVTFRGMDPSPEIEDAVRHDFERLARFDETITSCRVVAEIPHRHRRSGRHWHVRVEVSVPGADVVVARDPRGHERDDPLLAIHDAFDAARRQLQDRARLRRGDVKTHEDQPTGRVIRLDPGGHCGFIETADGREVYFHENSVRGGAFGRLDVGTEVAFVEEDGDKGPQATTVRPVARVRREKLDATAADSAVPHGAHQLDVERTALAEPRAGSPPAILVVEDEGLLRWVLAHDLAAAGFRVIEAADASLALATWAERGGEVAAVLLDLKLPGGGGLGVLERIQATRPACPVIVMTAHGTFETESEVLAAGAVALLCKPFDHDAVLGLLRGLVHAGA